MGRPLKGHLERKGSSWVASVPVRRGSKLRVTCSYPADHKADAQAWIATQIERLNAGLDAERPPTQGRLATVTPATTPTPPAPVPAGPATGAGHPAAGPDFATVAEQFVLERYELLRAAEAGRADDVRRIIRLHLEPVFGGPIPIDAAAGRTRVIHWVVACAGRRAEGSEFEALDKPVKRRTMEERLRVLCMILDQAHRLDRRVENFARGLPAQEPLGHRPTPTQLLALSETARVAGEMHVVHQLVLWILRVLGPRIGEPYGLLVGDFIDAADEAALLIKAQGGRTFTLWGDQPGEVTRTNHKESGKSDAAFRLVGRPRQLAQLLRCIIAAYHTDPTTGEVDLGARLVPNLQAKDGGQQGFRSALTRAGEASGVIGAGERIIPHDMRKNLCADFAWNSDLDDILKRRWVGHRAGSDVFAVVYALDRGRLADLRPAVRALEHDIDEHLRGSLVVPTTRRPLYARSWDRGRLAQADAVLADVGWQVSHLDDDWIATEEVAATLGCSVSATRRLFPDPITAIKHDGAWFAHRDAVDAYRDRFEGWHRLEDLVEQTEHDYHSIYRTLGRLGIEPRKDDHTGQLLLTDDQAGQVVAEFDRIAALHERSVPVATAARMLRASQSSVRAWSGDANGRLVADPESDGAGRTFITRTSISAELERRGATPKETVTTEELREYAGLDQGAIRALAAAGILNRIRTGHYTVDSVRRWAIGYRPDLLETGLLPPT